MGAGQTPQNPAERPAKSPAASAGRAAEVTVEGAAQATALGLYREMLRIRRFEEKAGQLYGMGLIGGYCHLCIGQEAVPVGLEAVARSDDRRITSYRSHGLMLACGMDPARIMAELLGRATGYSGGKGGSMHMASPAHGFFGGHAIVGAQVPIGTGLAFADRYRGEDRVSFVYFGDAAANQGQVAESYHLAALWKLPVIFVIENNQHGADLPPGGAAAAPDLHSRGAGYGIPGEAVDGMDVEAVIAAGARARAHCAAGRGPVILEMKTYRYRGHSMADPAKYRTREDMHRVRQEKDAIARIRAMLTSRHGVSEDALKTIDREIKAEVSAAAETACAAPEPARDALMQDVPTGAETI
ncbi:pyruvate dehydrogenase (acetyl-transferring) E1 component subunit alpha [Poseidonocella sedimentorum]|uniref:Pyruvate dehydrogenase E1 component subunit alpha n=1 Tax=Poseidonocella sedimentorum TaxID=871652 RepID=A0A1I6DGZ2_9RHOB|nr:pyruvate dehydrogenase (acetyl-transferring) E1 component subunit alpha [Poseidonocella sedimentorum]SFR04703.1 pyruvate dehydrogenase E1 component alpha subunit [Poseidonocella sedimentorum]